MNALCSCTVICNNPGRNRCLTPFIIIELMYYRYESLIFHFRNATVAMLKKILHRFSLLLALKKYVSQNRIVFHRRALKHFFFTLTSLVLYRIIHNHFCLRQLINRFKTEVAVFIVGTLNDIFNYGYVGIVTSHSERKPILFVGNLSFPHTPM